MSAKKVAPIFLDLPAVVQAVALSESTVQELVRQGQFPPPRQLSGRRVGWLVLIWAASVSALSLAAALLKGVMDLLFAR